MPLNVQSVLETLKKMKELENTVSEFYASCAERWKEDADFWSVLSKTESQHAYNLERIADLVGTRPQLFEAGRPLNTVAINTAISGVKANIDRLKKGELQKLQVLYISRDLENSILESKYNEVLNSGDIGYSTIISEIVSQTEEHRRLLFQKIDQMKAGL